MTLQEKLATACRILAMQGHKDLIYGHVSALTDTPGQYWIKGSGIGLEEVNEDDLVLIDLAGNKISGKRKRHNEFPIHSEVYRTNPDIRCVIHTHPVYSTIIASSEHRLLPLTNMSCAFYPPALNKFEESSDLIVTAEQGISVAKLLGEHRIVLLRNHGIVVAAGSVEEACVRGVLLEHSAKTQVAAASMGVFSWATDAEALLKRSRFYHPDAVQNLWEYFVRQLGNAN
jgi:L-ribulose-5-phosphate 4-epimerase